MKPKSDRGRERAATTGSAGPKSRRNARRNGSASSTVAVDDPSTLDLASDEGTMTATLDPPEGEPEPDSGSEKLDAVEGDSGPGAEAEAGAPDESSSPKEASASEESGPGESASEEAPAAESSPEEDASGESGAKKPRRRRKPRPIEELKPYLRVVEGLLFSSKEPVSSIRLASVIGEVTAPEVRLLLEKLDAEYKRRKRGVMLEEVGGGFRLVTVPDLAESVKKLHRIRTEERLTPAALETLAIVAYRQPVIRADIEVIRGVACGGTLKWLMEKGLIRIHGRADVLGRPLLYATSQDFLERFGINSLEDLPRVDEFRSKTD